MGRVDGKVAIVTGAASGIGRAAAQALAREGARVVLADRDEAGGHAVARLLGPPHVFHGLDVADEAGWARILAATLQAFERLDILVNAAGVGVLGDIETTTLADWRFVHAVNNDGVFLGCRAAIGAMKTAGGSIINVSSVAGLIGDPDMAAYCASKGAVRLFTKSVALHCARRGYGIRCNSVHPGFIATQMVDALIAAVGDPDKARGRFERAAPLGRLGEADEVAHLIVYLASDESRFTTGAEHVIDGGLTAR